MKAYILRIVKVLHMNRLTEVTFYFYTVVICDYVSFLVLYSYIVVDTFYYYNK